MYIPSAVSKREAQVLQQRAAGRAVVEAGSLLGYSTIQLARTARHVVSIDRHTGYHHWKNDSLRQLRRNIEVAGVAQKVTVVVGDLFRMQQPAADFMFIDLDGLYATTLKAIQLARAAIIGVHDFERTSCKGVAQAVADCGLKVIERVDSLVILQR